MKNKQMTSHFIGRLCFLENQSNKGGRTFWRACQVHFRKKEKSMNQQQFEQITRTMERRYGKIRKGKEEDYAMMLFPMESNLLKTWRRHPDSNSRRLEEAILLALHAVKSHTDSKNGDYKKFETDENRRLKDALLAAFDPFENEEVRKAVEGTGIDMEDRDAVNEFFRIPVMCMLRIKESVGHWEKRMGNNGYFRFLEGYLGAEIPDDEKMNYSILRKKN